jgi:hypothetical protein
MALLAIQVGADMVAVEREPWAGIGGGAKKEVDGGGKLDQPTET